MKKRNRVTQVAIRDAISWIVAIGIIIHQEVTGEVRLELLIVATTLLGLPGVLGIISLQGKASGPDHTDNEHTVRQRSQSPDSSSTSL